MLSLAGSLALIAFGDDGELWRAPRRAMCCRWRCADRGCCSPASRVITAVIGVGTAWLVTTFEFPGRNALTWLLPLPLAIPTYIVAYVYVDLLDALGPVQSALRAMFGWRSAAEYWFPHDPLARRRDLRHAASCSFLTSISPRARCFRPQGASLHRSRARARRAPVASSLWHITLPLARPAIAVGVALALARNAQRHRRQRISRRADADASRSSPPGSTAAACRARRRSPA